MVFLGSTWSKQDKEESQKNVGKATIDKSMEMPATNHKTEKDEIVFFREKT